MRSNKISFKGQRIFIGIDVHLKSWDVTCLTEGHFRKSFQQPPDADALYSYLTKNFPDGDYYAVYESGFTGFSTFYALSELGIHTMVVNAADIPTTQKELVMKTDRRDSRKLAESLRAGELEGIYIRHMNDLDDRSVVRIRKTFAKEENLTKVRIRHLLHTNGVKIPEQFQKHWSKAFVKWLREEVVLLSPTKTSLLMLLDHVDVLHNQTLLAGRKMLALSRTDKYRESMKILRSIPGVGFFLAMTLLVEIGDFSRFSNERQFASAIGLIPTSHSSGEKVCNGEKSFRGNKRIGPMLIEAAWQYISRDQHMDKYYRDCCKRMIPVKAIVKVARRMSNIILSLMKSRTEYDPLRMSRI